MTPHVASGKLPQYSHDIVGNEDSNLPDELRRRDLARSIARVIREHPHPRVIGVYGSWGAGKSYALSLTINELFRGNGVKGAEQIIVCPFKPWEYEAEGSLALGLIKSLREIGAYYRGRNPPLSGYRQSREIKRLATELLRLIADVLTNSGDLRLELAGGVAKTAAKRLIEEDEVREIRIQMHALVNAIHASARRRDASGEPRLVVCIDDLDRCNPKNMVSMFEWLKTHLSVEGVTYVLALDHGAAAKAIVGAYEKYIGKEQDIAYGFRYLEKLVDQEYELEDTSRVERMAIRDVYGDNYGRGGYTQIRDIARDVAQGDFPGINSMEDLISLRCLRAPRTMLKIVRRFSEAMDAIERSSSDFRGRLPYSFPFWTLFLIAINYRLDPETLGDFVDGRNDLYQLLASDGSPKTSEHPELGKEWTTNPRIEFWQFAQRLKQSGGTSLQLPDLPTLQQLTTIIRELIAERVEIAR